MPVATKNTSAMLLIGAGKMGNHYLQKLIEEGVPERDITVVDIDQHKLDQIQIKFPEVTVATEIPDATYQAAFVLSNSPAHLENLASLADLKCPPAVLVEKPLITSAQLEQSESQAKRVLDSLSRGYTAYLIDFSPAMEELLNFIAINDLVVIQGKGNWEKNRTADKRPTTGDLEDEMTHQLASLMALSRVNQEITNTAVSAKLTYLSYVDPLTQQALARLDESVPMQPNSATRLDVELTTNRTASPVLLSMWSSFTSPEQGRTIQVELSDGGAAPLYAAKICFDDAEANGDILKIWKYPNPEPEVRVYTKPDKLALQVKAFLRAVQLGANHPALKTLEDGLNMVKLAEAANASNQRRSVFIDVPFDI